MKIMVRSRIHFWTECSNRLSPLFTFLSVISFISDIFDHYYTASDCDPDVASLYRAPFLRTPLLHYTYINPTLSVL